MPVTPAYVYSESVLRRAASLASSVASFAGCKLLYTLKPCGLAGVLDVLSPYVDGFGTSSIFEARLAGATASTEQSIHCYSPAFPPSEPCRSSGDSRLCFDELVQPARTGGVAESRNRFPGFESQSRAGIRCRRALRSLPTSLEAWRTTFGLLQALRPFDARPDDRGHTHTQQLRIRRPGPSSKPQ